ncbi:O-methyltransferase [Pseudonocardia bannensis]|uniref:O-methyltransferase n=1 Tax=Pseudonocardia bannensis TaxID=630973 RepID=A0A848DL07_9PSEU|nr:O-methyltransferase [Pseudonocardia bannensis]NMH93229.1 O-methyltransferase [Pseudonocardia bannensis]
MTGSAGGVPSDVVTDGAVRDYTESYLGEDEVLASARERAEAAGAAPIGPGAGAALRFLAATVGARAVVEIGTGAGVSGLWLLRGMAPDGVLTSIDIDPEQQRGARSAFTEAGYGPSQLRLINGLALEVLPRLTDAGYDLVFLDGVRTEFPRYLEEAVRLLRPGGVVVLNDALRRERVTEPDPDETGASALRELAHQVRDDERLVSMLLPLGQGLLVATKVR